MRLTADYAMSRQAKTPLSSHVSMSRVIAESPRERDVLPPPLTDTRVGEEDLTIALETPRFACNFSAVPTFTPSPVRIQTKLMVNTPDDVFEQEADWIADQVTAAPAYTPDRVPRIQRFSGRSNGQQMYAAPSSVDQALAGSGTPLEPALRQDMEERFRHDFSQVRLHSGADAERSARDVNARAYTVGHDIVFGAKQFAPGTREGRRLLAHELGKGFALDIPRAGHGDWRGRR